MATLHTLHPKKIDIANRVLWRLRSSEFALWRIERLVGTFKGVDAISILDGLADLEHHGLIQTWMDCPKGPSVILSTLGRGPGWILERWQRRYRWAREEHEMQPISRSVVIEFADKRDKRQDCPERKRKPFRPDWRPTLLLGAQMQWYGPEWKADRPCRGCGGRVERLTVEAYCLVCDGRGTVRG